MARLYEQTVLEQYRNCAAAVLLTFAATFVLLLFGRSELGEGVIALAYLVPVIWSGYRWGQLAGISAALAGALAFDFLFIPPFYTFTIGSLEGWLIIAIFLAVAVVLVGRFEASLRRAREVTYMYEFASALGSARTPEAVAYAAAGYIQQLFQASLVNIIFQPASSAAPRVVVSEPHDGQGNGRPDCHLPVQNAWGLVGEIQIWRGRTGRLPAENSPLLQNFAAQTARALDRTHPLDNLQSASPFHSKPLTR